MEKRMTLPDFMGVIRKDIEVRNEQLRSFFRSGQFQDIPGIFKVHTKLITHKGEVILGRDCENYWREVSELGAADLNFEPKYFEGVELRVSEKPEGEEIDFVVFEITEFTFTARENVYNGYIDPVYRHRVRCTKDP